MILNPCKVLGLLTTSDSVRQDRVTAVSTFLKLKSPSKWFKQSLFFGEGWFLCFLSPEQVLVGFLYTCEC